MLATRRDRIPGDGRGLGAGKARAFAPLSRSRLSAPRNHCCRSPGVQGQPQGPKSQASWFMIAVIWASSASCLANISCR